MEPAALELSIDAVTVLDDAGDEVASAAANDADAVHDLLAEYLGTEPEEETDDVYPITTYKWGGVNSWSTTGVAFLAPEAAGLELRGPNGIVVGDSADDVLAAGGEEQTGWENYRTFAFDVREVPGTVSLERPGETGIEYISVTATDDVVTNIRVPGNDFSDL